MFVSAMVRWSVRRSKILLLAGWIAFSGFGLSAQKPALGVSGNPTFRLPDISLYQAGRYVYSRNCQTCHGISGDGKGEMAKEIFPKPRPFTMGIFKYHSTPAGSLPTDEDLLRTVRVGLPNTSMPSFSQLSDKELREVVEYVKFFSPRWKDSANYSLPVSVPKVPDWFDDQESMQKHALQGRGLYLTACAPCHGENGAGDGPAAAGLLDIWGDPIKPADLKSKSLRLASLTTDFYRLLITGISGTPMPSFKEALTEEQSWLLVAYLVDLRQR